ncbi:MAG: hypothetical protein KDI13_02570 [Alphaproteobacteria bacterium]|nr:hypothetical protein [Alphaproteobacteria bacterium]
MAKEKHDSPKAHAQEADGYDYPDMLMPEAWLKREPPENFIHDGIWLPEYFNITGKELYPDIWNETELYARSPQEIAEYKESLFLWRTRKGALRFSAMVDGPMVDGPMADNSGKIGTPKGFVGSHKNGVYFHDKEEEDESFNRKQKTIGTIIEKILNNEIHPFQNDYRDGHWWI